MIKFSVVFFVTVLILSIGSISTMDNHLAGNNTQMSVKIKYVEYDRNWNLERLHVNMTVNTPGHVVYTENYYSAGDVGPRFRSSGSYYDKNVTDGKLSFDISRPRTNRGVPYSLVKTTIILDGKVVSEKWLDSLWSTQYDVKNISASPIVNMTNMSNSIKNNTSRTDVLGNISIPKTESKKNMSNISSVSNAISGTIPTNETSIVKKFHVFEIIMVVLVGLMIIVIYRINKDKE